MSVKKTVLALTVLSGIIALSLRLIPEEKSPEVKVLTIEKPKPKLTIEEKKAKFIASVKPAIDTAKAELESEYAKLFKLSHLTDRNAHQNHTLERYRRSYKAETIDDMLSRMHIHPTSIILAQAALESGWGTSRLFKEANNIFGIWSFNKDEPRIAANETRGEKTIYLKKYDNLKDSVKDYFLLIAKGPYREFREARKSEHNAFRLIPHLRMYSELRDEYVERLYYVMKVNRFYEYDQPQSQLLALNEILPEPVKIAQTEYVEDDDKILWNDE